MHSDNFNLEVGVLLQLVNFLYLGTDGENFLSTSGMTGLKVTVFLNAENYYHNYCYCYYYSKQTYSTTRLCDRIPSQQCNCNCLSASQQYDSFSISSLLRLPERRCKSYLNQILIFNFINNDI